MTMVMVKVKSGPGKSVGRRVRMLALADMRTCPVPGPRSPVPTP
ncbi:hypothetical protein SAMN06296416_106153 [Pseudoxanthomonas wuyuanensis]|uniref:Uncharacterized protein n=1 Tax=Pseudoxanthomonas wuyuanensis TaxID=1073196 RepID=A0A286D944_9GAMM|nr:hypothetical protein SAMN06296416_106153 [Pseudoxanthomonas wuyuanensis]